MQEGRLDKARLGSAKAPGHQLVGQAYDEGLGESGGKRIAGQEPGAGVRHGSVGDAGPADDMWQLVRGASEEDGTHLLGAFGITRSAHCAFVKP